MCNEENDINITTLFEGTLFEGTNLTTEHYLKEQTSHICAIHRSSFTSYLIITNSPQFGSGNHKTHAHRINYIVPKGKKTEIITERKLNKRRGVQLKQLHYIRMRFLAIIQVWLMD